MTAPLPARRPDALDLAEKIDGFANELKDAASALYRPEMLLTLSIDYARDVVQRLSAALDAYEARS